MDKIVGGIEAGGTKFVCAVGSGPQDIRIQTTFPTTAPMETMRRANEFFRQAQDRYGELTALGIASFGPLDPNPESPTYGHIRSTPKPGWSNFDFVGAIRQVFSLPISFDTDVNGAALSEWRWGAAQGLHTFIYLTVGTGIGGGCLANGRLIHGLVHPEMGHFYVPHDRQSDPFPGVCPFHGDCLEGLASGPALEKRWGQRAETLPADHPAWEMEAHYLALGLINFICTISPQRIIMGGGVMNQPQLFPLIRAKVQDLLKGYVEAPQILVDIQNYIVPPGLGSESGVLGAIALAYEAGSSSSLFTM
jgi:fructokinase